MLQLNMNKKDETQGEIQIILRIDGKILYFKFNNNQYAQQMISKMQEKGAIISVGRKWVRINMFGELKDIKLGNKEFNVDSKTTEEMEQILGNFYIENFTKAGFKCEHDEAS